jgi:hypothetical protein
VEFAKKLSLINKKFVLLIARDPLYFAVAWRGVAVAAATALAPHLCVSPSAIEVCAKLS